MEEISRRKVLVGTATFTTAAVAGCVSGDDGGDDENDGDDGGNDSGGNAVEERSITTVGTDCAGTESDTVLVVVDGTTYTVEGTLPAATPCYLANLVESSVSDGTLSLSVDVEEDPEEEACIECDGEVSYDATVETSEAVETVTVSHETGETHTVESSEFREQYREILSTSIETTNRGSRSSDRSEDVELSRSEQTVTIEGLILTSTPHHEAVLEEAAIEDRKLEVSVDTESTLEDNNMGTTELGFLEYEATVEMDDTDTLEGVTVEHPEGVHGFGWETDSATASGTSSAESDAAVAGSSSGESTSQSIRE